MSRPLLCSAPAPGTLRPAFRLETLMRPALALPLVALLGACSPQVFFDSFTRYGTPSPEFGLTAWNGAAGAATYQAFNNPSPLAIEDKAAQICTLGYTTADEQKLPAEPGEYLFKRVTCTRYRLDLSPGL
jgi:hypothetical protein